MSDDHPNLTRRERQIMDLIYAAGEARARDVEAKMTDAPSYATVRTILRVLEEKGHLDHRRDGKTFIYFPTSSRDEAAESAARRLVRTFFDGSVAKAVSGILGAGEDDLDDSEIDDLERLIAEAKQRKSKG